MRGAKGALAALLAAGLIGAPVGTARADGGDGWGIAAAIVGTSLVVNTGFTVYDSVELARGTPGSRVVGAVEILLTAPQAAGLIGIMASDGSADPLTIAWTAWATLLTVHGTYALFHPERETVPAPVVSLRRGNLSLVVAPGAVVGADGRTLPGLSAVGHF